MTDSASTGPSGGDHRVAGPSRIWGPTVALTVAGSDSGAGAGIQADLKTFSALGVFGTTALTAVTAQSTVGVDEVMPVPTELVAAQIDSVLSDLDVEAVKTGMLATSTTVEEVAGRAADGTLPRLVVDPVLVSSTGDRLLDRDAEASYIARLLPHAMVATPNLREAALLAGMSISDVDEMREAAARIRLLGPRYVVVKGGHLAGGGSPDVIFDGSEHVLLQAKRVDSRNLHGTGCTLSAAIAARLALGDDPLAAISCAKAYVTRAIAGAATWRLGRGNGPVDHMGWATAGGDQHAPSHFP